MSVLGVVREASPERRVALTPEMVARVRDLGLSVVVETGAGAAAWYPDSAYREAGADVVAPADLYRTADIVVGIGPPDPARVRPGLVVAGLLDEDSVAGYVARGATAVDLTRLPRTLSRAQAMDALTSQAGIAGYKAALVAANTYERYLPMLMTAAGTVKPASVLVLGAGVAGLAAIGTARRLGAVVTGYDIRPDAAAEVRSLGARFLDLAPVETGVGDGGYARALTGAERSAQQAALQEKVACFDIVITTAKVPGRTPPVLVTAEAVKAMRPGSVLVDLAAGPDGGNVAGSVPDTTVVVADGITIVGAGNLPSAVASGASAAYARNITALLGQLVRDGVPVVDPDDEVLAAIVTSPATGVVS